MPDPYILLSDDNGARKYKIDTGRLTIGRHAQNGLPIEDQKASRFHAEIIYTGTSWIVRDLKSSNGTSVNGKRVIESLLQSGDVVEIGTTRIRFIMPQSDESTAGAKSPAQSRSAPAAQSSAQARPAPKAPPAPAPEPPPTSFATQEEMRPEDRLVNMAAALPVGFVANDIIILNARGQISLPPVNRKTTDGNDPNSIFRLLLLVCAASGASDIHIEPHEKDAQVRIRVDGTMIDACVLNKELATRLLSMVKVLADLDIAQRSSVQDGNFSARVPSNKAQARQAPELRRIDYRVSFAPSVFGQKLVVRVQDNAFAPTSLDDLNLPDWMRKEVEYITGLDSGMVLVSGPTGSGKTTTLYSLLRSMDTGQRNVITIENPVEIQIPGITQLPVDDAQGKTFAALLRSILRQDPDVILVGEIRDEETARTAMQASITGHLVLSTVHTKDTFGTIYRLLDLGIEPFLLSQALATVIAQRLVRQLCPHCKKMAKPTPDQLEKFASAKLFADHIYQPVGCDRCFQTGYSGRRAIFELLTVNDKMREAISRNLPLTEIAETMSGGNFRKLLHSGYELVALGVTSFDEIDRTVGR